MSLRGEEWKSFSEKVLKHVEEYCVKQYGDAPNDQAENWTVDDCIVAIKKYANRHGTNAREGQDELDLLKIAHYACLAYFKHAKEESKIVENWILKVKSGENVLFTSDSFYVNILPNVSEKTKKIIIEVVNESE